MPHLIPGSYGFMEPMRVLTILVGMWRFTEWNGTAETYMVKHAIRM